VLVLETLIRSRGESPATIAEWTGLVPTTINPILERLIELHYVTRSGDRYKGVARPRGA